MTSQQKEQCRVVIHGAATAAAAAAAHLAQIPVSDAALLVPIQIGMVVALGKVFKVDITEAAAKGLVLSTAAMWVGRGASQVVIGWLPIIGNAFNAATAFGLTEWMGWKVANRFSRGDVPVA